MAPEQTPGLTATERSDLFAVGALQLAEGRDMATRAVLFWPRIVRSEDAPRIAARTLQVSRACPAARGAERTSARSLTGSMVTPTAP